MNDLETLLLLDGEVFVLYDNWWVKFEVRRVESSASVPHGIKYSLTLHDKHNRRVIGHDNAHSFKPAQKYGAKKETYDHIHKKSNVVAYEFESATQLLEDFLAKCRTV